MEIDNDLILIRFEMADGEMTVVRAENTVPAVNTPSPMSAEDKQPAAVQEDGIAIRFIKNPSEGSVQRSCGLPRAGHCPASEAVQLAAVQEDGIAIRFIENPSEAVQLAAVQQDGTAIRFIKNPSVKVMHAAVSKDRSVESYILTLL